MPAFDDLDDVISAWVAACGSTLFTEWAGAPARYFHLPGDPPFECFQISVRELAERRAEVSACAIDTNDDTESELVRTWEGAAHELDDMLRSAMAVIDAWKARNSSSGALL